MYVCINPNQTFHNSCMRRMMGRYRGIGGPSTAELLDGTGKMPITQLLSHHRVRWLGHAARKPDTTRSSNCCRLHPDARPVGRPHCTWMEFLGLSDGISDFMLVVLQERR